MTGRLMTGRLLTVCATRAVSLGIAVVLLVVAVGCASPGSSSSTDDPTGGNASGILVAAASDLRPAFEQLGSAFTDATGVTVSFTFGSSGQLRQQIVNGAPFDLFASANVTYVDDVVRSGRGVAASVTDYAEGRLVLWTPDGVNQPDAVADLVDPAYRRIAIANPRHAPYGMAAAQALESAGVAEAVADRLVLGENISDTFEIVRSGNADVGIVALSVAIANELAHQPEGGRADGRARAGTYGLIDRGLHEPLRQALVVTSTGAAGEAAAAFAAFVASPEGRSIMERYGFVLPEPTTPDVSTVRDQAGGG
jgi:molybdate transport system substrate-binding protein